jgi:hypothetical protein
MSQKKTTEQRFLRFRKKTLPKIHPMPWIREKFIPDPGGKKAPDPGSGSATLIPGYWH